MDFWICFKLRVFWFESSLLPVDHLIAQNDSNASPIQNMGVTDRKTGTK